MQQSFHGYEDMNRDIANEPMFMQSQPWACAFSELAPASQPDACISSQWGTFPHADAICTPEPPMAEKWPQASEEASMQSHSTQSTQSTQSEASTPTSTSASTVQEF